MDTKPVIGVATGNLQNPVQIQWFEILADDVLLPADMDEKTVTLSSVTICGAGVVGPTHLWWGVAGDQNESGHQILYTTSANGLDKEFPSHGVGPTIPKGFAGTGCFVVTTGTSGSAILYGMAR